jgi:hypothetical protein
MAPPLLAEPRLYIFDGVEDDPRRPGYGRRYS